MPHYAIFATPLSNPFWMLSEPGSEYSTELDAETDEDAMAEADRHFQPHLLAIHWYPTREKAVAEGRTVVDYEDLAREEFEEGEDETET